MNNNPLDTLSFLVIGGGSIGKRHIKNLQSLGYYNIYCLKRKADQSFEGEFKVKVVTSIEAIIEKINIVIVCTPTSLHIEGIKIAKILDAAVLMEKPLIHNAEGLTESNSLVDRNNNLFFIGFMLRYHPLVLKIKELIEQKVVGEIYAARFSFGSYLPYWHPWENHQDSYASQKKLGGGVINTITHELDLIQYFFGTPLCVTAEKVNFNKLSIEVEEIAEAIFKFNDKLVTLHLDYLQKDYDRNIFILGDNGSIKWNWHENKVKVKIHKQESIEYPLANFDVNQLYIDELKHFIELYKNKILAHPLNFEHAFINTKLMLAIHKAAETGQRIKLNQYETN
jgi:predicted dehydrogenase